MGTHINVRFAVLFILMSEIAQLCPCGSSNIGCIEEERQTLLKFKARFNDPTLRAPPFSTWEGNNCCQWEGIVCNNVGHVIHLNLSNPCFPSEPSIETEYKNSHGVEVGYCSYALLEAQNIDSSIQQLKHLTHLDLKEIRFSYSPIPMFLGSMTQLTYLSLSHAGFQGRIPHNLGNLTNLRYLDLSSNDIYTDEISWISQLSSLQHLDLSGVDIRKSHNLFQVLDLLPSLLHICLSGCELDNSSIPYHPINLTNLTRIKVLDLSWNALKEPSLDAFKNMSSIRFLDLSGNDLTSVPSWLANFNNLVHVDLSGCLLHIPFPNVLQNMTSLKFLDLSYNSLFSVVPPWLGKLKILVYLNLQFNELERIEGSLSSTLRNMCSLRVLDFSNNKFQGEAFGANELYGCTKYNLQVLDLCSNNFNDSLPAWFGQLENLRYLHLESNLFSGSIPFSFGKLSKLMFLYLSYNYLNGTIPQSLSQLVHLYELDLSNNNFGGVIPQSLGQLVNLTFLDLSNNHFHDVIPRSLSQLVNLMFLNLSRNNLYGSIPSNFGQIENLYHLDLSSNSLNGALTEIIGWSQKMSLDIINIASNHICGSIPENIGEVMPSLGSLLLGNNQINGSIPYSMCKIDYLRNLDLSNNTLSGEIPNCWRKDILEGLGIVEINFSSNNLSGLIPSSFGNLSSLSWLHLNKNNLKGKIPFSLKNLKKLVILDLGENQLCGNIPSWTGEMFSTLQILRLRQNKLNGSIPSNLCQLSALQILDLADNNLMGLIPHCIGNLKGMSLNRSSAGFNREFDYPKNLLQNQSVAEPPWNDNEDVKQVMKGRELEYTRNLKLVVNMDLSNNNLDGLIPDGIVSLTGLHGLNLSHNHLRGEIPRKIGNMKSLESFDVSYNKFSGRIPNTMSTLTFLSYLNLSYNNFSGPIPIENQFFTLDDPYNYIGNPLLCGASLPQKCTNDGSHQIPGNKGKEEDDKQNDSEKVWFYFVIGAGFASGFWGVIGVLLIKKRWRHACFRWVDNAVDDLYIAIFIKVARLKRMMLGNNVHE